MVVKELTEKTEYDQDGAKSYQEHRYVLCVICMQ